MRVAVAVLTLAVLLGALATLAVRTGRLPAVADPAASGAQEDRFATDSDPAANAGPRAARAATTPTPGPAPDYEELRRRIDGVLDQPGLDLSRTQMAIAVRDAAGRVVYDHRAHDPQLPASTIKLVAAALSLDAFGPDHRFTTTVDTDGRLEDGRLTGDLVLRGAGDPALATPYFERYVDRLRPRTPMEELADSVEASGVETVTGDIVADTSVLAGSALADGWKDSYLSGFNARRIRGLTVNAGLRIRFDGPPSQEATVVRQAPDPAREAGAALRRLLAERGVSVEGGVRVVSEPAVAPAELASVSSPPLEELLTHMIRESDNHLADTLVRAAAAAKGGDGSWVSAEAAARDTLEALGVDATGVNIADGSGLSRADRMSAAQLAELDAAMARSRYGQLWDELMAVAGESGTLEHRLADSLAAGVFRGKTGTLRDVTAVAGTVHGPDGTSYHLAAIANQAAGEKSIAREIMNQVVLLLAEDQRGCVRDLQGAGGGSLAPGEILPYRLNCPSPVPQAAS